MYKIVFVQDGDCTQCHITMYVHTYVTYVYSDLSLICNCTETLYLPQFPNTNIRNK